MDSVGNPAERTVSYMDVTAHKLSTAIIDGDTVTLFKMFESLAQRYVSHPTFVHYDISIKEDIASEMKLVMMKKYGQYDTRRANSAFSYFTSVAKHAAYRLLHREYKYRNRNKAELQDEFGQFDHLDTNDRKC